MVAVSPSLNVPATPEIVKLVTANVSPSKSVSVPNPKIRPFASTTVKVTSSGVVPVSFTATGSSLIEVIVISNVAVSVSAPSVNVYVVCGTEPLYSGSGTKVNVPSAFNVIVPIGSPARLVNAVGVFNGKGCWIPSPLISIVAEAIVKASPSGSLSKPFPKLSVITSPLAVTFSFVVTESSVATGASFTGVTVITNSAVSEPPFPSSTV